MPDTQRAPDPLQTPQTTPALLKADALCFSVGGKRLLDDVGFTINSPGITAIMGPNGAGKSLLVRLLHGLIEPSAGEIMWGGRPMSPAIRKQQAMVFQKPVLLRRSVAANINFVLKLNGGADLKKCEALLKQAGLFAQADQPARKLSGGEQQRLALARALACAPRTLFLDEPCANLDPAAMLHIEETIAKVRDEGTKIFLVTHDAGQARRLAADMLFLHHGRLLEHSPADAFFTQPATGEASAFLEGRLVL